MENKCCGTCKWSLPESISPNAPFVCCNEHSRCFNDYTQQESVCPSWEGDSGKDDVS